MRMLSPVTVLLCVALLFGGCSSTPPAGTQFTVPSGRYAECFDAARDVLTARNYRLNRVDASGGVITTHPAGYVGVLTPWNARRASMYESVEETLNQHTRVATVRFTPTTPPGSASEPGLDAGDLRDYSGELMVEVVVSVERASIPGTRVDSGAIGLSTVASNPLPGVRHLWPRYSVPMRVDENIAGEIVKAIKSRLVSAPQDR